MLEFASVVLRHFQREVRSVSDVSLANGVLIQHANTNEESTYIVTHEFRCEVCEDVS